MSVFWVAFLGSSFLISFLTAATDTFEKLNIEVLFKSFIKIVLGSFAYYNMALKIGWEILSAKRTTPWKPGIFRSFTVLKKSLLRISVIFTSSLTISSSMSPSLSRVSLCWFYQCYFFRRFVLSESKVFTVRQKCLLSVRSFSFKFA